MSMKYMYLSQTIPTIPRQIYELNELILRNGSLCVKRIHDNSGETSLTSHMSINAVKCLSMAYDIFFQLSSACISYEISSNSLTIFDYS